MEYKELDFFGCESVAEPEVAREVNRELNLANRIINETGTNLFLTGKAGTGKTTFLRHLQETSDKRMIVLAPTGVAAINAEGSTIHSFFQLPFSPFIPGTGFIDEVKRFYSFNKDKRRIFSTLDLLIIDEISMVRPDTLDAIDSLLRKYRNNSLPFGGVQLLLIGDLRQLSPVVKDIEWDLLKAFYKSPYFFESIALKEAGFTTIELKTIYRQSDAEFIEILNAVRDNNISEKMLAKLNERYIPDFKTDINDGFIRLTTHNYQAAKINAENLVSLHGDISIFDASVSGNFPESSFPADIRLQLKVGAQVLFIKNDSGNNRRFYNGLIGHVSAIKEFSILVDPIDGGETIEVEPVEWQNTKYVIDNETDKIKQEIDGTFTQYPLRLAWAITIHKSQGLTFDKAIIDADKSFAPGQTYVALSRCRSLEGLVLGTAIPRYAIIVDQTINSFVKQYQQNSPNETLLNYLRSEYTRKTLAELFYFSDIKRSFDTYNRYVMEYVVPIYPELYSKFTKETERLNARVEAVGNKFINLYTAHPIEPEMLAANSTILDKIKNGCDYFREELIQTINVVENSVVTLDNKQYNTRLQNSFDDIIFKLKVKCYILNMLTAETFTAQGYYRIKNEATLFAMGNDKKPTKKNRKPTAEKTSANEPKKEKREKGYSKRISIVMFMEGKSISQIAAERGLVESTIAGHLTDSFIDGTFAIKDAISADHLKILSTVYTRESSISLADFKEKIGDAVPDFEIRLYFNYIKNS